MNNRGKQKQKNNKQLIAVIVCMLLAYETRIQLATEMFTVGCNIIRLPTGTCVQLYLLI